MLPVDLVYRHILPHAFEHPREVLSLLLVCSHFAGGASRPWFWHPFVRRQKRGIVALVERDGRLDAEERAGLLACVARNWTPELLLGAFEELRDCIRALVNEHDFGLVQRIRTAGTRDRSCSVFVGYQDGNGSRNGPAVTFFASGNYFRGNYAMDTFLGPIEFWWKCGMYFQGYTLVNMRVGAGSIWFQDGHVFKCENWDGSREAMCQSQSGTWTLPDGKTTVDGTLSALHVGHDQHQRHGKRDDGHRLVHAHEHGTQVAQEERMS